MVLATVDLQVTLILPMNIESIALSVQGKSSKQIFKMDAMAAIWDFLSQRLSYLYLQVTPMLPIKFRVSWPFSSEEEGKNRFSRWPPSWTFDRNHFSYFYIYKSTRCFLPIFNSTAPLVQENKRKKRVSNCLDFRSKQFKLFYIYKSPQCFLPSFETKGLSVQEKKRKIDFHDGCHGGNLVFLIGTILAIFDHPDTSYLV